MNKKKIIIITSALVLAVVVFLLVRKYLQRKQAREILELKVTKQNKLDLKKAFDINRWKTGKPKISDAKGREISQKINNSIGWFTEDEDQINKAFYGIQAYDDLSVVAYQYKSLFDKSLYSDIEAAYKGDDVKLARLRSIIAKKVYMS
jgi:hypothetical protein